MTKPDRQQFRKLELIIISCTHRDHLSWDYCFGFGLTVVAAAAVAVAAVVAAGAAAVVAADKASTFGCFCTALENLVKLLMRRKAAIGFDFVAQFASAAVTSSTD